VLSAITSLKKLCNHPKLVYDTLHSKAQVRNARSAAHLLGLNNTTQPVALGRLSMFSHAAQQGTGGQPSTVCGTFCGLEQHCAACCFKTFQNAMTRLTARRGCSQQPCHTRNSSQDSFPAACCCCSLPDLFHNSCPFASAAPAHTFHVTGCAAAQVDVTVAERHREVDGQLFRPGLFAHFWT
jgi:hypothetical protein